MSDDQPIPDVIPEPPEDAALIPPDGLERATWLSRRIREIKAAQEPFERVYHAEVERLRAVIEAKRRTVNNKLRWYELELEHYHRAEQARNPKAKTIDTVYGTSRIRQQAERAVIDDDKAVVAWALTQAPETLDHKVRLTDWRKRVHIENGTVIDPDTGEVVPGARAHTPEPSWSFTVADGEPF